MCHTAEKGGRRIGNDFLSKHTCNCRTCMSLWRWWQQCSDWKGDALKTVSRRSVWELYLCATRACPSMWARHYLRPRDGLLIQPDLFFLLFIKCIMNYSTCAKYRLVSSWATELHQKPYIWSVSCESRPILKLFHSWMDFCHNLNCFKFTYFITIKCCAFFILFFFLERFHGYSLNNTITAVNFISFSVRL